jgi:hypothetical protein
MAATARALSLERPSLARPILVGGGIAGILDQISAFISLGHNVPRNVAAGLIGPHAAFGPSILPWVLGFFLHFFIAYSAATIYCVASRRLPFLADHWLVCGLYYGISVFLVMYFIVMPLCAFHYAGPYRLRGLIQGLLAHMLLIGLPISYSLHKLRR